MSETNYPGLLQQDYIIPSDPEQAQIRIRQYFNNIASLLNYKETCVYTETESFTGQKYLPIDQNVGLEYRGVFRTVVDTGALPNATSSSVAHGLTITSDYTVTRIYGAATDPTTPSWIPLPFAAITDNDNIEVEVDGTNVVITTGVDRTAYTRSQVVLEYMKVV